LTHPSKVLRSPTPSSVALGRLPRFRAACLATALVYPESKKQERVAFVGGLRCHKRHTPAGPSWPAVLPIASRAIRQHLGPDFFTRPRFPNNTRGIFRVVARTLRRVSCGAEMGGATPARRESALGVIVWQQP
jgi:hypothetical protein